MTPNNLMSIMRKSLPIFILALLFQCAVLAQPILSDDCGSIYNLGLAPACPDTIFFTNVGATESTVFSNPLDNIPSCWTDVEQDVWIQFDVPADGSIVDFTITVTGIDDDMGNSGMVQPQLAAYRGECLLDELAELECIVADPGEQIVELDLEGLTPGLPIFLRINEGNDPGSAAGTFQICVDSLQPINLIDEGGSTSCSGELYDSGGPDEDYSANENNVFTICPNQPNNCIIFTMEYYNMEEFGDELTFYDGDGAIPGTEIVTLVGGENGFDPTNVSGGGGVCFEVQASSGCMTVEFTSNGATQFEGFAGSWQCTAAPCIPNQSITTETGIDPQQIIDAVTSAETIVEIDTIICNELAYGTFLAGDDTDLGMQQGLLLTSGSALGAVGPNDNGSESTGLLGDGDPDLDSLTVLNGGSIFAQESNDACVIELDVFAATEELQFEYIFGSEEYTTFVNSSFNDIFAFFVSGPGIVGVPELNNQINIAVIPGTNTPVEINSVNNLTNWEYYRNNEAGQSTEYDGLTSDFLGVKKSLTASFATIPCNTYHIKLAIADRGDTALDSGVFISEIKGGSPDLSIKFATGVDYFIEDCTGAQDSLIVQLSQAEDDTTFYQLIIGGTAMMGVDYTTTLQDTNNLVFPPGETTVKFPIIPITDMLDEGTETITIQLTSDFGCGVTVVADLVVELRDEPFVQINAGQDSAIVCDGGSVLLKASGAVDYIWTPASVFDSDSTSVVTASPDTSQWVTVIGTFPDDFPSTCFDVDSIFLEVLNPQVELVALSDTTLCEGDTIVLQALNNTENLGLEWTASTFFINILDTPGDSLIAIAQNGTFFPTSVQATIDLDLCSDSDNIPIDIDDFQFPEVIPDTTICQGESITLANPIFFPSTTYEWAPDTALDDATVPDPIASPLDTTVYQVVATSASGFCVDSAEITVNVVEVIEIEQDDIIFLCLGDTAILDAEISAETDTVLWSPNDGILEVIDPSTIVVNPSVSTTYFATATRAQCTYTDSVFVRVDSLPDNLSILPFPDKPFYCIGDTVTLISEIYDPIFYPDIQHSWSPSTGVVTPLDEYNLILFTTDTITYTRVTTQNACSESAEITLNVVDPTPVLSVNSATICPGESFQVELLNPGDTVMWAPPEGLSCTDCPDPIVAPNQSTTYTITNMIGECSGSGSLPVTVINTPLQLTVTDTTLCEGESFQVEALNGMNHEWSPVDTTLSCTNCPDPFINPPVSQTYTVTAEVDGCDRSRDLTVTVIDTNFFLNITDTSICRGQSVQLIVEDGNSLFWSPGTGLSCNDCANPTATPNQTTLYTVLDSVGRCSSSQEVFIEVNDVPEVEIAADPDLIEIFQGERISLEALIIPDTFTNLDIQWTGNPEFISTNNTSAVVEPLAIPESFYTVNVVTADGCFGTATIGFTVKEPQQDVPSAFTPNRDGVNDQFGLISIGLIDFNFMQIFNRWGEMVFESQNVDDQWDGTMGGKDAPADVYIYIIEFSTPDGEVIQLKGDVTLIR